MPTYVDSGDIQVQNLASVSGDLPDMGTGSDRVLLVWVMHGSSGAAKTHDSVTIEGVALTQVTPGMISCGGSTDTRRASLWRLAGATLPTGLNNTLAVTASASCQQLTAVWALYSAASGVGAVATPATGNSNDVGVNITPTDATAVLAGFLMGGVGTMDPWTPDGGLTEREDAAQGNHAWTVLEKVAGATSVQHLGAIANASNVWAAHAVEILPAAAGQNFDENVVVTLEVDVEATDSIQGEGPPPTELGYVLLDAAGEVVTSPDDPDVDWSGALDIRMLVERVDWTPAATTTLFEKFLTTGNQRSFSWQLDTTGRMRFLWSDDGATPIELAQSAVLGYAANTRRWVRVTHDPTTGAVDFWDSAPTDGASWADVGGGSGAVGAIHQGTAPMQIGDGSVDSDAKVFALQMLNGIGGSVMADPDFRDADQTANAGATFVDSGGKTWTLAGGATWVAPVAGEQFSDDVSVDVAVTVTESDALSVAEDVEVSVAVTVSVTDELHMAEDVEVSAAVTVSVGDDQDMAEDVEVSAAFSPSATDARTLVEDVEVSAAFTLSATDVGGLLEDVEVSVAFTPSVEDARGLTEDVEVSVAVALSAVDVQAMVEALEESAAFTVTVEDALRTGVVEDLEVPISVAVSVADGLTGQEDQGVDVAVSVSTVDVLSAVEALEVVVPVTVSVEDEVAQQGTEVVSVSVDVSVTAVDVLHASEDTEVSIGFESGWTGQFIEPEQVTEVIFSVTVTDVGSGAVLLSARPVLIPTSALGALTQEATTLEAWTPFITAASFPGGTFEFSDVLLEQADAGQFTVVGEVSDALRLGIPREFLTVDIAVEVTADDVIRGAGAEPVEVEAGFSVTATDSLRMTEATEVSIEFTVSQAVLIAPQTILIVASALPGGTFSEADVLLEQADAGTAALELSATDLFRMGAEVEFVILPSVEDALSTVEAGSVDFAVQVSATDDLRDAASEVVDADLVIATDVIDVQAMVETPSTDLAVTVSATDSLRTAALEALSTDLAVSVSVSDALSAVESLEVALDVSVEAAHAAHGAEAGEVGLSLAVEADDVQGSQEAAEVGVSVSVVASDVQGMVENPVVLVEVETDAGDLVSSLTSEETEIDLTFLTSVVDVLATSEAGEAAFSVAVSATDHLHTSEEVSVGLVVSTDGADDQAMAEPVEVSIAVGVVRTDVQEMDEDLVVPISVTTSVDVAADLVEELSVDFGIGVSSSGFQQMVEDVSVPVAVTTTISAAADLVEDVVVGFDVTVSGDDGRLMHERLVVSLSVTTEASERVDVNERRTISFSVSVTDGSTQAMVEDPVTGFSVTTDVPGEDLNLFYEALLYDVVPAPGLVVIGHYPVLHDVVVAGQSPVLHDVVAGAGYDGEEEV